jgi:Zn-dependent protease with chaperone function
VERVIFRDPSARFGAGGQAGARSASYVRFAALFFLVAVGLVFSRLSAPPALLVLLALVLYRIASFVLPHVDGWLLPAVGGRLVDDFSAPQVHNVVEEVCIASGFEKPRIAVIDDPALNAFAHKGRRPEKNTIFLTAGLLEALERDELQGVVAHELADLVYGPLGYLDADDVAVHMTRNPTGLRRALERIASGSSVVRRSPRWFRSLWFEYPSKVRPVDKRGEPIVPSLTDRIAAVAELEGMPSPEDGRFESTPASGGDVFYSVMRMAVTVLVLVSVVLWAYVSYALSGVVPWMFIVILVATAYFLLRRNSRRRPTARG